MATNPFGISDQVWSVLTPEEKSNFSAGNVTSSSLAAATAGSSSPYVQTPINTPNASNISYGYNSKGEPMVTYTQGNSTNTVARGSIFDPTSNNFNPNAGDQRLTPSVSPARVGQQAIQPDFSNLISGFQSQINNYQQQLANQQKQYLDQLTAYQNAAAEKEKQQREAALRTAFERNQQGLNAQNATVANNYQSAINKINAAKASQIPQYQTQRDAADQQAAQQLRQTQAVNALTGKYFSGANRSQQLAVDLARQQALGNINQAENQFNTDITNRLSDVDAQRVAALNDLAQKLQLNEQQYNEGNLDVANQMASQQAANAANAFVQAANWGQNQQQIISNDQYRNAQLNLQAAIAAADQAYKDKQLTLEQRNNAINQVLAIAGLNADNYWKGVNQKNWQQTFDFNKTQQDWDNQFKMMGFNADQAAKAAKAASKPTDATTISYGKDLVEALQNGVDLPYILNTKIPQLEKIDPRVDVNWLKDLANSMPVDNWQYIPGYK